MTMLGFNVSKKIYYQANKSPSSSKKQSLSLPISTKKGIVFFN